MSAMAMILSGSILFPVPNRHITNENFERIREVMGLREVEAILGGKTGDYRTGPNRSGFPCLVDLDFEGELPTKLTWDGDDARIEVWINSKGRIVFWGCTLMCPERLEILRTLLWRCQDWRRANLSWLLPLDAFTRR